MGPYWYRNFNNFGTTWDFYERLVKELMGNEEVVKQAELKDTVTMKIRKGGKVYRVILTEITPEEDKIWKNAWFATKRLRVQIPPTPPLVIR